jgi:DNA-binding MarR family transcriptional regulator
VTNRALSSWEAWATSDGPASRGVHIHRAGYILGTVAGAGVDERKGEVADAAEALYHLMVAMARQLPRDLSWTAASTLATVVRTGPRRVTDLAVLEAVAQPSMTALVRRLESAGLVERRPDPADQRVVLVAATPKGEAYVRARARAWAESTRYLVEKLSAEEARSIVKAAPAIAHLLELYSDEHGDGRARSQPLVHPLLPERKDSEHQAR